MRREFRVHTTEVRLLEVSRSPVWKEKRMTIMQDRMR